MNTLITKIKLTKVQDEQELNICQNNVRNAYSGLLETIINLDRVRTYISSLLISSHYFKCSGDFNRTDIIRLNETFSINVDKTEIDLDMNTVKKFLRQPLR